MADGLNDQDFEDLAGFLPHAADMQMPAGAGYSDEARLRAKAIVKDIYARHGIPTSVPLVDAAEMVEMNAGERGIGPAAWRNPEERAQARLEFAKQGRTPEEQQQRWEESAYLMDPQTAGYMQNYARDSDFLLSAAQSAMVPQDSGGVAAAGGAVGGNPGPVPTREGGLRDALANWDASNNKQTFRDSWLSGNYERTGGVARGVVNATTNPDVPFGAYANAVEVVPDSLRAEFSGEAQQPGEAIERAQAKRMMLNRYRLDSTSPILDLPADASADDVAARLARVRESAAKLNIPAAAERWQRSTGWTPPGFIADATDSLLSSIDPTMAIPVVGHAAHVARAAQAARMASRIAGPGWARPYVQNAARAAAVDMGRDQAFEQGINAAVIGGSGMNAQRTWPQYLFGGGPAPHVKSNAEVDASRAESRAMYEQLRNDDGVSRADEEAYKELGVAQGPLGFGAARLPVQRSR